MSALAALGWSLPQAIAPAPIVVFPPVDESAARAFALLDDLLKARRIMPTEHRTIRQALEGLLARIAKHASRDGQ